VTGLSLFIDVSTQLLVKVPLYRKPLDLDETITVVWMLSHHSLETSDLFLA